MDEMEMRRQLSEVALGNVPVDILITHGRLFNVYTREFIPDQAIWIKNERIAYVGPDHDPLKDRDAQIIDSGGMVLLPGLIDGHTHMTASKTLVDEFVKHVIPTGTTTVITETIELGSVVGKDGIEWFVRGLDGQPIRFFYTVPPLCGLTAIEEAVVPSNEALAPFLKDPKCVGLGEIYWSNLFLKGIQSERVLGLVSMTHASEKRVEGHTAGASGKKLQAYTCFGVSSCHEPISEKEVLERLRLGYWVMIREGSVRQELPAIRGIFHKKLDFRRLTLCTDSVNPIDMIEKGYLDASLRKALKLGVPPELAYQMVTINVAEHFHLDHLIGALAPGKMADVIISPSPEEYSPQLIMVEGKPIFKEGKTLAKARKPTFPDTMFDTVKIGSYTFPPIPSTGKVRALDLVTGLVTKETIADLDKADDSKDLLFALAIDRSGSGKTFLGFLRGFGLKKGAIGSTMAWDTGDMIAVGRDLPSLKAVIERVKEIGGGIVFAEGNEIVAELPARVCGILSTKTMEETRQEMKQLEKVLKENGVPWENPLLTLDTLTGCAIPHLRITHHGYVRMKDRQVLSWEV
jgi:adenine deaminase